MRSVFLALCFLANLVYASAQAGDTGEGIITGVSVLGLKRTKPHIAEYPLRKFIGREAADLDIDEVRAAVIDTGILEPLSVEIGDAPSGEGKLLLVTVAEKWSIFPLPLVMVGSGGSSFGLFFLDANAFGLNDKFALGAMYGQQEWMGMLMYQNTPDREGVPGWNVTAMFNRKENQDVDRQNRVLRSYNADLIRAGLGISYPFTEYLSGSMNVSFSEIILRESDTALLAPAKGARVLNFSPAVSIRDSDWDGYLLSQRSASLTYTYGLGLIGASTHSVRFQGVFEQSLVPGFRVNVRSGALYNPLADSLAESGPQAAQVDILPRNFSARNYAGLSLGLEKYLLKFSQGTLSVLASYQVVYSQGPLSGDEFDHGVSGGIRFFLSKFAFPALGLGVAYNLSAAYFQYSFTMGMSF
ncbi:hypothetical protein FACS189468_6390 [Spirochaetia bacterium]|nr:hypothetical protein FACS189468_6390 [Spirochaetia bacterium]